LKEKVNDGVTDDDSVRINISVLLQQGVKCFKLCERLWNLEILAVIRFKRWQCQPQSSTQYNRTDNKDNSHLEGGIPQQLCGRRSCR